ncbi:MAG TPA: DNA-directed RNA polymerase subunit omega [Thermoanaerobaculaceae bacterium]|nr:DNA-directed RNA polymerase subunit omega [Thermoanaerobaculaceae bacterium]
MSEFPQGVDSTFRHILIAAKRAEQLIAGARPRVAGREVKPTTIALAELAAGRIPWRAVTAEEYEAILQQEVAAREAEEHLPALLAVPAPVLPPVIEAEGEGDEEEEELETELEGPKFDENLEVVEEAVAEELLTEDLPAEE